MTGKPYTPRELTRGPFTTTDARRAGLTRSHLEGHNWRRVGPALYTWSGRADDPALAFEAALRRLPPTAAFSGLSAAWLHGLDVAPCDPIEVTVPIGAGVSARSGMALRRAVLPKEDVVRIRGWRVTSMVRTLADLSARLSLTEAVVVADAALHLRKVRIEQLTARAARRRRGVRSLRRVISFAEPATGSPMESRLRMLLVLAGLPRPKAQVPIYDRWGRFIGRPDLYYEECKLGIEYDGGVHRHSLAEDNRRQNNLLKAGVRLLRFTAPALRNPDSVAAHVRAALASTPHVPAVTA